VCLMPALLSRPTIGRFSAMISDAARRTLQISDRSHRTDAALCPFCSMIFLTSSSLWRSRPTSTTVPCLASSKAVARPMPEVGPVMMYALRGDAFFKPVSGISVPIFVCLVSLSLAKKIGDDSPEGLERSHAVFACVGWVTDHEVDRRFRQRVHQGGDEPQRSVAHWPIRPRDVEARLLSGLPASCGGTG